MRLALLASCAALAIAHSAEARGQPAPPSGWYPSPPGYPVTFVATDQKLQMDFSTDPTSAPFVHCIGSCDLWLAPREYFISVPETDETLAGRRKLKIEWPARATVEPRGKSGRQTGLIMGISGIALMVLGVWVVVASSTGPAGTEPNRSRDAAAGLGVLAVVGGAILTPLGWVKYGRSGPTVELERR